MKKKLSLVMIALMAIAAFAGLRRAAEPVTLTWDFSEDVFANADNPEVKDTLEIGAEGYDYRGMILHMLFTKNSGGKDYVTKKYGFRPNGSSTTSNRYIQYTPEYDGQLKVYYASNNTSATDRIVAVGTAIKTFKQAAITSSEVPTEVVAYGLTNGGTVLNFDANLTKGTTYYIYMADGGSRITKLEFTYTPAEEQGGGGASATTDVTFDIAANPWEHALGSGTGETAAAGDITEPLVVDGVTLLFEKSAASTPARFWTGPQIRVYNKSVFTLTAPEGKAIKKVVFTSNNTSYTSNPTGLTEKTWEGNSTAVKFYPSATVQLTKIVVTLADKDDQTGAPVSIANDIEHPYSVAKAIEIIDAGMALNETVFVQGIISQIDDKFNETNGTNQYWISDDGTTTNQMEVYNGLGLNGAKFTSKDDIALGATVIVTGTLTKYNTTYEFNANNQLANYVAPDPIKSVALEGAKGNIWDTEHQFKLDLVKGEGRVYTGVLDLTGDKTNCAINLSVNGTWLHMNTPVDAPNGWGWWYDADHKDDYCMTLNNSITGYKTYTITATWVENEDVTKQWSIKIEGKDFRYDVPEDAIWYDCISDFDSGIVVDKSNFASLNAGDVLQIRIVDILNTDKTQQWDAQFKAFAGEQTLYAQGLGTLDAPVEKDVLITGIQKATLQAEGLKLTAQRVAAYITIKKTETPASDNSVWIGNEALGEWGNLELSNSNGQNPFLITPAVAGKVVHIKAHEPVATARPFYNRALADNTLQIKKGDYSEFDPVIRGTAVDDGYVFTITEDILTELNTNGFVITSKNPLVITEIDIEEAPAVDVTIEAADITEGDITAALTAKTAGIEKLGNITINLAAATAYTVSAPIEAPASLFINGNGASITAATTLITTPAGDLAEWMDGNLIVKDATIDLGANAFYVSAGKNYLYNDFKIENCVVKSSASIVFDFRKGGVAKVFTIDKSTVYSPTATTNSIYSSQSAQKGTEAPGVTVQTFAITNSTLYNFANGKNFFTHRQSNQTWLAYNVENSIFVNCGKSGQVIKGMNGGQGGPNPTWTITGNIFNFDGVDTSASESTGDSDHTADATPGLNETVQNSIAGVVTFTNAAEGDFNAQLGVELAPASETVTVGDPRWTITAKQVPTAVVINAADITEGDITTAVTTKTAALTTAGYLVGDITINLAAETAYTVTAPIEAPASLFINGNGASITAATTLITTPAGDLTEWMDGNLIVKDATIDLGANAFYASAGKNYLYNDFKIENCVVKSSASIVFDFRKGGVAKVFTIDKSTVYSPTATTNSIYSSQSAQKGTEAPGVTVQTFAITNSTLYNFANGKNFFTHRQSNQTWLAYNVENSIFVNCGKSGQVIKGMNGGQGGANPTWIVDGNIFNFDGVDTSASESTGDSDHTGDEVPGLNETVQNSIAGVVTFTDAANGNFAGNVEMPFGATEPTTKPGDPRWTLTYSNAPQKFAITVAETTNGTAVADKKEAAEGEKVTITVTPAAGFELDAITGVNATAVEGQDGKYEFTMPAEAVTVTVTFKQTTGIQSVKAEDLNDAVIYNLNGARVSKAGKGLYIINGKKVVIK